jgi:hypothetical protein
MGRAPQILRQNNHAMMEAFLALQQCTWKDLHQLKLCCLCLKAELLSEICVLEGCDMLPEIWQGLRPHESKSTTSWPKQAQPFETLWTLWQEALKHALQSPEVLHATKACTSLRAVECSTWRMDWITTPLSMHVELTCISRQHCSLSEPHRWLPAPPQHQRHSPELQIPT